VTAPQLVALRLADPPEPWAALGFSVTDGSIGFPGLVLELGAPGRGIVAWRMRGMESRGSIDGLSTEVGGDPAPDPAPAHANGAIGLDHVVAITPRFDRTAGELARAGLELRRIREAPGGVRQGFRRLGPAILELVEARDQPDGPARFWGLVVNVANLDALAQRLGDRLGQVKPAVQPGRRIATLRDAAGLGEAVAFMSV
jgi:hypothetical protein